MLIAIASKMVLIPVETKGAVICDFWRYIVVPVHAISPLIIALEYFVIVAAREAESFIIIVAV